MDTFTLDDVIAKVKESARLNAKEELRRTRDKARTFCQIGAAHYGMTPEFDAESIERYCIAAEQKAVKDLFSRLVCGFGADDIRSYGITRIFDASQVIESP